MGDDYFEKYISLMTKDVSKFFDIPGPRGHVVLKPKTEEKESMKCVNVSVLRKMADSELAKDLEAAGVAGLPDDIMAALKRQQEREAEENAEAAATEIMTLLKRHDECVESHVMEVRRLRKQIATVQKSMSDLNTARAYGLATRNFLPLANSTGMVSSVAVYSDGPNMYKVPEGWTAPVAEESAE